MSGLSQRFDGGPQPAGRAPAPGCLGYVQAFCNSFWALDAGGNDAWADPRGLARWLGARGLASPGAVTAAQLDAAVAMRETLRGVLLTHHDGAGSEPPGALAHMEAGARDAAGGALLVARFEPGGEGYLDTAGSGVDAAVALALATCVTARSAGTWRRLKACPHVHCGWVFYDRSRNAAGHWCSMRICGNRSKGERFRALHRPGDGPRPADVTKNLSATKVELGN